LSPLAENKGEKEGENHDSWPGTARSVQRRREGRGETPCLTYEVPALIFSEQ